MGAIDLNTEDAVWGSQFVVTQAGINIRVHASPGNDTPVEALLNPGDGFQIAGWPEYMDGYQWWKIRTPDGVEGWVVDNPAWYRRR